VSTAIIIDPALRNYAGHHFTAVAGWVGASRAAGFDLRILANKECIAEAAGPASIEKVFQGGFYGVAPTNQNEAWKRLRAMQRAFRDDLSKPLMQAQSSDVIVLAHSTLVTLNGIAAWAAGMPRQRLPRLMAWLMFKPEAEEFVTPLGSQDCLVAAIDRLRALFGDQLILAGSTRAVCRRWEALVGGAVHFLPFTALRSSLSTRKERSTPARPLIVSAGHLGTRKGINFIPALIKEFDRRQIPVRWKIAGSAFNDGSAAFAEIAHLARSKPNVSLVTDSEGLMEYDNVLAEADLAILPYSPEEYKARGSGVAEEAELIGLPYVAPQVEFSAEAVSAGAAVSFDEWTIEGISSALVAAVSKLPELSNAAMSLSATGYSFQLGLTDK
jgi:glycosyltransferase involved in cell wall biosynthesis